MNAVALPSLVDNCWQRYPLLGQIEVVGSNHLERPPAFLALLLALLESESPEPLCLLLPARGDIARIAAVILGISRFWRTYATRLQQFAQTSLRVGSRVCVRPKGDVFEYLGPWPGHPDLFRLRTLPKRGQTPADLSFPLSQVLRLEPTTKLSPKGNRYSFDELPPVPLDNLLGIETYGNRALFTSEVLIADGKESFLQFANLTRLRRRGTKESYALADIVPLGEVHLDDDESVDLRRLGELPANGAPLVALGHSSTAVAKCCKTMPARSAIVMVNGAARLTNLQDFDDIVESQRLVLMADQREADAIEPLLKRGCRLWEVPASQLRLGNGAKADGHGMFSEVCRRAQNCEALKICATECESESLDGAVRHLIAASNDGTADPQSPCARTIKELWGLVSHMAAIVGKLDAQDAAALTQRVEAAARAVKARALWIADSVLEQLNDSIRCLQVASHPGSGLGDAKISALMSEISRSQEAGDALLLVSRPDHMDRLSRLIESLGPRIEVCTPHSIPPTTFYDRLICTSWPGTPALRQVLASFAAPTVSLLSYPFEARWMRQFRGRIGQRTLPNGLSRRELQQLLSTVAGEGSLPAEDTESAKDSPVSDGLSEITVIEERMRVIRKGHATPVSTDPTLVAARYVGFHGATYAYLTPTRGVSVVTDLIRAHADPVEEIPERTISALQVGDFVVFPEGGDKDLLHVLADRMLGERAPRLRGLAARWRDALRNSGLSAAEFQRRARELHESRHILTIRNWFSDEVQIGPRSVDDLTLIALVTEDRQLDSDRTRVWEAISELRGMHLSAGVRLRDVLMHKLPAVLHRVEESGTRIELEDLGSAWVVQIECIAASDEQRLYTEVNRLIRDDDPTGQVTIPMEWTK